jgi:putative hydrolase of the HAD superfamily
MAPSRRYDAISFDAGYTLIDSHREAAAVVADLLAELGITPDDESLQAAYHRAERLFLEDYFRPLNDTWEADERILRFYRRYYRQLLGDLGIEHPDDRYAHLIIERYLDPSNWRTFPGVLDTLAALRERGYRMGIASDWGSGLTRILHALALSRYMDWAVISGAIGAAKPSPHFYGLVLKRANAPASRIVHVGDSYYADVRGARTVGMEAILIDWRHRGWPRLDVPVIHDLAELLDILES